MLGKSAALLLVLLALWPPIAPATATGAPGIDLVIAIDQSGSMAGFREKDGTLVQNDPFGRRVEFMHSVLWSMLLQEQARQGYTTRVSVVEFGARDGCPSPKCPQVTLHKHLILPASPGQDLATIRQKWEAAISRILPVSRGDTDHPRALELVRQELLDFARHPPAVPPSGQSGPRKPVVLLITDGEADVPKVPGLSKAQLREETRQVVEDIKRQFPANLGFVVVGITDPRTGYWKSGCETPGGCGSFWRELATPDKDGLGQAYSAENEASPNPEGKLPSRLGEVLKGLTDDISADSDGNTSPCGQDRQTVPPYLRALQIQVDFDQRGLPLAKLHILNSQGQRLMPGAGDRPSDTGVAFDVAYPQPGPWKLRDATARYRVCLNYELEQAHLIEPPSPAAQGSEAVIRYRLEGRGPNKLFEEQPGFPVRFSVTVRSPTGTESSLDLRPDPAHPGEIVGTANYPFRDTGEYRLKLRGESVGKDSFTVYASKDPNGDLVQVEPGTPVRIRVEAPAAGETLALSFGRATIPVRLAFVNAQDGAILSPGAPLAMQWLIENAPEPATAPPPFVAATVAGDKLEASLDIDSGSILSYLLQPGAMRLHVQPVEFAPGMYSQGVEGGDDWYSAPYPFRESRLTLALFVLVPVVLLGLAGWALWYWGGAWCIRRQDRREKLKPRLLLQFSDHPNFNQAWSVSPGRLTRPSPNKAILPDETDWAIEDFQIRRRFAAGAVRVQVRYRPRPDPETGQRASLEKAELGATDDNALRSDAKHRVKGLGPIEAYFVLLAGKAGEGMG